MRFSRACLLALLFVSLSASFTAYRNPAAQATPFVVGARIKGKNLIISGVGFGEGAVVLINGEPQKSKNDPDLPSRTLRVPKGKKRISSGEIAMVQVQNTDGELSDVAPVYGGANIHWTNNVDVPRVRLQVGERVLLYLTNFGSTEFQWSVVPLYPPGFVRSVDDAVLPEVPEGARLQLFEAVQTGSAWLFAGGDVPCKVQNCPGRGPMVINALIVVE
jgi:hypothetical protein